MLTPALVSARLDLARRLLALAFDVEDFRAQEFQPGSISWQGDVTAGGNLYQNECLGTRHSQPLLGDIRNPNSPLELVFKQLMRCHRQCFSRDFLSPSPHSCFAVFSLQSHNNSPLKSSSMSRNISLKSLQPFPLSRFCFQKHSPALFFLVTPHPELCLPPSRSKVCTHSHPMRKPTDSHEENNLYSPKKSPSFPEKSPLSPLLHPDLHHGPSCRRTEV